jgi:transcription initiation factor TFIIIB Brf1 subunit/transcription initiation factor TFIIB
LKRAEQVFLLSKDDKKRIMRIYRDLNGRDIRVPGSMEERVGLMLYVLSRLENSGKVIPIKEIEDFLGKKNIIYKKFSKLHKLCCGCEGLDYIVDLSRKKPIDYYEMVASKFSLSPLERLVSQEILCFLQQPEIKKGRDPVVVAGESIYLANLLCSEFDEENETITQKDFSERTGIVEYTLREQHKYVRTVLGVDAVLKHLESSGKHDFPEFTGKFIGGVGRYREATRKGGRKTNKQRSMVTEVKPEDCLLEYSTELALSEDEKHVVSGIIDFARKENLVQGKNPRGILAASVYIGGKMLDSGPMQPRTQTSLSALLDVSEMTIRSRYKDIAGKKGVQMLQESLAEYLRDRGVEVAFRTR